MLCWIKCLALNNRYIIDVDAALACIKEKKPDIIFLSTNFQSYVHFCYTVSCILILESMDTISTIYAYTMQTYVTCLTAEINKQTIGKVNWAVALIQTHSVGFANFSNIILSCQAACKGFYITVQKAHFTISFIPDNCRHSQ